MKKEYDRIENNYQSTLAEMRKENIDNVRVLQLSIKEITNDYPNIKSQLDEMNIKLKNVLSINHLNTNTITSIKTTIKDSIVNDTTIIKTASYKDSWTSFKMIQMNDSIDVKMNTRDSITIILNYKKRSFLEFISFKKRILQNTVKNYNPNSSILYNRLIQVSK